MMDRVRTGIPGFDELIEGGFPKTSNVLLTGLPGTGKTIFALEYLYNGAMNGENGIYVTLDESFEMIKEQAMQFGWDFDKLEAENKIAFISIRLGRTKLDIFDQIRDVRDRIDAKRLVFDNLATFSVNLDLFTIPVGYAGSIASTVEMTAKGIESGGNLLADKGDKIYYTGDMEKRLIYLIVEHMSRLGTTNLVLTYGNPDVNQLTIDGVSEFACDGIVELYNQLIGAKHVRTITVLKMRNTNQNQYINDLEIGKNGLVVKPVEKVYG
ncbi:MAG: hypothetical protein KGI00_05510 [Candidatus Micrarchaeota archaeon]|nr:hypothetical protein [Candidatus Micrarchaeota archaeon]MDE1850151.1 hypothetical protein [Candidatus Micrarchaeota archaeon]